MALGAVPFRKDDMHSAYTGSALRVVIKDRNNRIIGRGSNFSWTDTFEQYPVDEYGKNGVDEYATGRMLGSGTLGSFFVPIQELDYPTRESFLSKGPFTITTEVAPGRPSEGAEINEFRGVKFTQISGAFGPTGLVARNCAFVYTERRVLVSESQ